MRNIFSLKKCYVKRDGQRFQDWMETKHPDVLLVSLERACSGARQDICVMGACAIFWNRKYYIQFLHEQKRHKEKLDNKMVRALYIILSLK